MNKVKISKSEYGPTWTECFTCISAVTDGHVRHSLCVLITMQLVWSASEERPRGRTATSAVLPSLHVPSTVLLSTVTSGISTVTWTGWSFISCCLKNSNRICINKYWESHKLFCSFDFEIRQNITRVSTLLRIYFSAVTETSILMLFRKLIAVFSRIIRHT